MPHISLREISLTKLYISNSIKKFPVKIIQKCKIFHENDLLLAFSNNFNFGYEITKNLNFISFESEFGFRIPNVATHIAHHRNKPFGKITNYFCPISFAVHKITISFGI